MSYLPLEFEASKIFPQKTISIRPDVHITFSNGTMPAKTDHAAATTAPVFELSYTRKNAVEGEVSNTPIELRPGYAALGFLGEVTGYSQYDNGEEISLYSIWVSPEAFNGFCESVCNSSSLGFDSFQKAAYSCCDFKSDAREESIVHKLDTCFMGEEQTNKLLLESYILELLSINIERLFGKDMCENGCHSLSKTDIESLTYAREVLLTRLESPPTLLELSRIIQMNDCKLKSSFKRYFGKTVYEFVREQRLEKAFSLLEQGEHNVTESAFAVGYANVSHFSAAFQKKFGIMPRTIIK